MGSSIRCLQVSLGTATQERTPIYDLPATIPQMQGAGFRVPSWVIDVGPNLRH